MKIVALIGSPEKNGNSEMLLKYFLEGVSESSKDIKISTFDLKDFDFDFYCHACKTPLSYESKFKDLMKGIEEAQGLIIATPTYNFSVPAKLKNLIDRMGFMALDYQNLNKFKQPSGKLGYLKTYFIVTGGTPSWMKKILFPLFPAFWLQVVFWYYGAKRGGSFYAGGLTFSNPAKNHPKLLSKCKKLGKKFISKFH